MTQDRLTIDFVTGAMGDLGTVETTRTNRFRVRTTPDRLREAVNHAKDRLHCDHVVHVATADNGKTFEIQYFLTGPHRMVICLWIELPRDNPRVPTVHDLLPPAGIYERQVHDLFGITFEGHPDLRRIILNEDWPEGEYPLRKDWKMDPRKYYGGVPREAK